MTGQREQPSVQQQQTQPQKSHLTLTGRDFFSTPLIRPTVALNSSGATRDSRPQGNSALKRLLSPNLQVCVWKSYNSCAVQVQLFCPDSFLMQPSCNWLLGSKGVLPQKWGQIAGQGLDRNWVALTLNYFLNRFVHADNVTDNAESIHLSFLYLYNIL